MDEKVFLNERGVTVTSARFIVPAQTFAMSGLTSVKMYRENPSIGGPVFLIVFGVVLLIIAAAAGSSGTALFGILLAAAGIALIFGRAPSFHVLLHSASGEAKALSSPDQAFIQQVVTSLNDSIIHRG